MYSDSHWLWQCNTEGIYKRFTEKELLKDLNPRSTRADELAMPLPLGLSPLKRLKDPVIRYGHPLDSVWGVYFDSEESCNGGGMIGGRRQNPTRKTVKETLNKSRNQR